MLTWLRACWLLHQKIYWNKTWLFHHIRFKGHFADFSAAKVSLLIIISNSRNGNSRWESVNRSWEPDLIKTNWRPGPVNTNWWPGSVITNCGPGLVNINWSPRPVYTIYGPEPGVGDGSKGAGRGQRPRTKQRAWGQEILSPFKNTF